MEAKRWAAWIFMLLLPLLSNAQEKRLDPADPAQTVVAPRYESAFKNYQAATDSAEFSDKAWRAANDQVARLRGHAGHLRDAEPHEGTPSSAPAKSTSAPTTSAQPSGHAAHHGHGDK